MKYFFVLFLLFLSCDKPKAKEPQVYCNKDGSCCYKTTKDSSLCGKYEPLPRETKSIYFQINY